MSKLNNYEIYDKENGNEISTEVIKSIQKEEFVNRKKYLLYMLENKPEKLTSLEIEEGFKYTNKKLSMIKEYDFFEEYYTGNKKKLVDALKKLSDSTYKCFSVLIASYTSCENTIQFNNNVNIIKDKDFSKILEISLSKWYNIKKELINNKCIRKIDFDNKKLYKINPMIIGHSMKITKATYYAFRDSLIEEFDKLKTIYWDKKLIEEFGKDILN